MVEVVKVLNREYADNPLVFDDVPTWLDDAISKRQIVPEFRTEDYWYYLVETPDGRLAATPGDLIVNREGKLYVFTKMKARN